MGAILVDTAKFISAISITASELGYFTISWYILGPNKAQRVVDILNKSVRV
jgi:hypothetical protein